MSSRRCALVAVALLAALPGTAAAQAWLPPEGEGTVTVTYQGFFSDTHLDRYGDRFNPATITSHAVLVGFDYGLTDRCALELNLGTVANRYQGPDLFHGPVDNGRFHAAVQDARAVLRYALRPAGRWAVTPFVGAIVPTHAYETRGHSAPGRRLRALQLGVSAGRALTVAAVNLYVQGQYSYAFVERVEGVSIDRSHMEVETGWAATPRVTVTAAGILQRTHGGFEFPLPRDEHFHESFAFHDRVARANYALITTGATMGLTDAVEVYATGAWTLAGQNTHAVKGASIGVAFTFGRVLSLGRLSTGPASARRHRHASTAASASS